jgi:hypothetical protein
MCEPGSVVGIANGYVLDSPGFESRWGRDFPHLSRPVLGTGSFVGVKSGRCVSLTPHSLIVPWSWKGRAIPLLPVRTVGLYRASVPIQGCTLPFFTSRYVFWRYHRHRPELLLLTSFRIRFLLQQERPNFLAKVPKWYCGWLVIERVWITLSGKINCLNYCVVSIVA